MRRIVIWLASTLTVVVLLFGYHTSTDSTAATSSTTAPAEPSSPASSRARSSAHSSSSTLKTKTYTGNVAQTRWGPVQVKVTVTGGTISKVTVLQSPSGNPRDTEINNRALPVLIQSTLDAQNAKIDMVSGATVTSDGYVQSLQSALDAAGI